MKFSGKANKPTLLIHGGAGRTVEDARVEQARQTINSVLEKTFAQLTKGISAIEAVSLANFLLEDSATFNAGKGAVLQNDEKARLTASIMDGTSNTFSAAHNIQGTYYPSKLAIALQKEKDHVLDSEGAKRLAEKLGIKLDASVSQAQLEKLRAAQNPAKQSTIGAVAIDKNGNLAAATSTGGVLNANAGRMSDVGTVAGNYATQFAAISCTGIGDHIVNNAAAARIESRVRDGMSLEKASERQLEEAQKLKADFGWIAVDSSSWAAFYSSEAMSFGVKGQESTSLVVVNNK